MMRITSGMMMSNYRNALGNNLSRLNDENGKISSEMRFSRASDDPVAAMKTLKTYRQLANTDQYQQSVSETSSWMTATESAVSTVDKILTTANSTIVAAKNGTYSSGDAANQAKSVDSYQQELLQTLNSTFNGQYIFGGSDNSSQPFKIGTADESDLAASAGAFDNTASVTGKLLYNIPNTKTYVPVSAISNAKSGDPNYTYSINNPTMKYSMPVDVGLGITTDTSKNVVSGTAFESATSALDFLCQNFTGASTGAQSENIVDSLGDASTQLKSGTTPKLDDALNMVKSTQDSELKATVVIGEKSKTLGFLSDKLTNDNTNLNARLSTIADIDITEEYTKYQTDQQVYNASLSIGTNILQHSIFDFLK
jgi:flagellar hook-associated protein 3 FlgL